VICIQYIGRHELRGKGAGRVDQLPHFFISRAGTDAAFADRIGRLLEDAGYRVVLQQWDFANRNFMERMDAALGSGARVIALLSPQYLASDHCAVEWYSALTGDPLNKAARVIVLRIRECEPRGLLRALAYWDLVKGAGPAGAGARHRAGGGGARAAQGCDRSGGAVLARIAPRGARGDQADVELHGAAG
jgi:TIR domain